MAKEGLFNWLAARIDFASCEALDLFAGTGNLTWELISRGALNVKSVDKHPACVRYIEQTARLLDAENVQVYKADAFVALERVKGRFDLIVADPPYDYLRHRDIVQQVMNRNLLKPGGWLVMEHPVSVKLQDVPGFVEQRHYGKVHFSYFQSPEAA